MERYWSLPLYPFNLPTTYILGQDRKIINLGNDSELS